SPQPPPKADNRAVGSAKPSTFLLTSEGSSFHMRLYIETMDAVLVDYEPDGRVRLDDEDWSTPTLQERRAILHTAQTEIERLQDLVLALDPGDTG
ncbi:MAG: hypothetical protein QF391_13750, partial [Myxococcota bacterium]|nr:hypothetical protein [Myxococcota bacterium]